MWGDRFVDQEFAASHVKGVKKKKKTLEEEISLQEKESLKRKKSR